MITCTKSSHNFSYMFMNLVAELGEFSGKVAKAIRKENALIYYNYLSTECGSNSMTDQEIEDLRKEAGDCLWQLSGLCKVMGWSLEDVAQENLSKLASRKERGQIVGDGDNR